MWFMLGACVVFVVTTFKLQPSSDIENKKSKYFTLKIPSPFSQKQMKSLCNSCINISNTSQHYSYHRDYKGKNYFL